ncbi:MAG: DUF368 domain-containing protein [Bacteroidales bacterium]|jgi:putative membrane protein|nr:DUF368 domain-containing protein [Bacteroidales bacterium]
MEKKDRNIKYYLLLYAKGMGMGAADIVPGVSGGTIAFITGVYETLLQSLRSFTPYNFGKIFSEGVRSFWETVNGNFLTALLLGVATSIFTLAKVMLYLLENQPVLIWSFFFGLILISTVSVLKTVKKTTLPVIAGFVAGTAAACLITSFSTMQTPDALWFIFISGAIAICAMILPGISGSFILLLLGKYEYILAALAGMKITVMAVFAGGAVVGLLSFSHFLSWLLKRFHDLTIALLAGFMCGSLNKVWPWKVQVDAATGQAYPWSISGLDHNMPDLVEKKLLPHDYAVQTGFDGQLLPAVGMALLAIAVYWSIETAARKLKTQETCRSKH